MKYNNPADTRNTYIPTEQTNGEDTAKPVTPSRPIVLLCLVREPLLATVPA